MSQQAAHPQTAHHQADIACADSKDIQSRDRFHRERQSQNPPVQEKEHEPGGKHRPYLLPSDFLSLDSLCAHAGEGKQKKGEQLRVKDGTEQPRRAVKVHQDFIHHADIHALQTYGFIAEPVHVHDH